MINYSETIHTVIHNLITKNPELLGFIRENRYHIADTELTYRQLNSLDQAGLLTNRRKSNKKWRTFNMLDLLYLHIVNKTREFNTNNAQLVPLKTLFYDFSINYIHIGEVLYSEIALLALLIGNIPVGIALYSDGEAMLTDNISLSSMPDAISKNGKIPLFIFLYETFKPTLQKVLNDEDFKNRFDITEFKGDYSLKPITRKEKALLKIVKKKSYSEITIKKQKNGDLLIHAKEAVDIKGLTIEDMIKIFDAQDYVEVNGVKRDGKVVSFKKDNVFKV